MIGLPRPGCRETVTPIEQHEYTRHIAARHRHGRLSTRRASPNPIGASGQRIADRRIWTTASRMNQARLFSGHQFDHENGMSLHGPRSHGMRREPPGPPSRRTTHVHFSMYQMSRGLVQRALWELG
jgi:hypothetical protein